MKNRYLGNRRKLSFRPSLAVSPLATGMVVCRLWLHCNDLTRQSSANLCGWESLWLGISVVGNLCGWESLWLGISVVGNLMTPGCAVAE
ncbi:MAG: hypothetical protein ACI9HK_003170 [Pirellulaceae bacterium]|jgi:hypothetical protein